jgi:hypothetical protein
MSKTRHVSVETLTANYTYMGRKFTTFSPQNWFGLRNTIMPNIFILFQPNAHNMLITYIYHQLPPICLGVGYTIFRETNALFYILLTLHPEAIVDFQPI